MYLFIIEIIFKKYLLRIKRLKEGKGWDMVYDFSWIYVCREIFVFVYGINRKNIDFIVRLFD